MRQLYAYAIFAQPVPWRVLVGALCAGSCLADSPQAARQVAQDDAERRYPGRALRIEVVAVPRALVEQAAAEVSQ